ncbi:MAG: exonuclease domain-containing protein [bacterium]|nr:exonuclease domain-containing protein [bacterium]
MSDILHTFVALDLQTTGLKPVESEIIEIGAVRVINGQVTDRFQTYVHPDKGLPDDISRLTGITSKDVRKAPKIGPAIEQFLSFAGDLPVMVHHGRFEARFISEAANMPLPPALHSVRDLARTALPCLSDHRVDTLTGFFEVEADSPHKALRDAEQLAGIFIGVVDILRETSLRLKQQMLQLLQGTQSTLLPILVQLGNEAVKSEMMKPISNGGADLDHPLFNIGGDEVRADPDQKSLRPVDPEAMAGLFGPSGAFASSKKNYEVRQEQIDMVKAVTTAFNQSHMLVVEAGTGVGKSMAYLAPAIYHAVQNNRRVIVSTNTKNLQEQLFYSDLPQLEASLNFPFSYVLLKGRSNYICLNRWLAAVANSDSIFSEDEREGALPLVIWAEQTRTGDISENSGFDNSRYAGLWAKICSDSGYCRSQRCRTNGRCYANGIRKAAQKAHIVVVNHSLLFSDIVSDNAILGEYEDLIIDEAHNVERVAAQYLGRELTIWRVKNLTDQLRSPGFSSTGTLPALRHWLGASNLDATRLAAFESGIGQGMDAAETFYLKAQLFFEDLTEIQRQKQSGRYNAYTEKVRYRPGENTFGDVKDALGPLVQTAATLGECLQNLSDWLKNMPDDSFPNQDELANELEGRMQDCSNILGDLDYLTNPDDESAVYWLELPHRENSSDTRLFSAPLHVADVLQEALYDPMSTIVFTSATLGIRGKLIYFLRRMGLDLLPVDRVKDLCLGSPFDYAKQSLVCAPQFMPSPKSPDFQGAVDDLIKQLALKVNRGTLGLFTSYSMLNRTYQAIKLDLQSNRIALLGQGIDGTRASITERFKSIPGSVLLGTDSFWEGVDIPGEALEILCIVRLPFAVPSEPLVAAHMEELEKQGKDPFMHYSVPEAILRFRQGFGRLIRNKTDRGIVIVLDSRVTSTRYGKAFLEALPVHHTLFRSQSEMIRSIETWFEKAELVA